MSKDIASQAKAELGKNLKNAIDSNGLELDVEFEYFLKNLFF